MTKPNTFPGFESPGANFEQPFEMLHACHDRVRRSLSLLEKLVAYLDTHGPDEKSRSAAADVLRYFDLAAPLHHQDEEINVFPVLLARKDAALHEIVNSLQRDHLRMNSLWSALREPLARWSRPDSDERADEATRNNVILFSKVYASHLQTEEGIVFPAARACMNLDAQHLAGQHMQARRQA